MIFYFTLLMLYVVIGLAVQLAFDDQLRNKIQTILFIVIFGSVSATRAMTVGTDTQLYRNLFENQAPLTWQNLIGSKYPLYNLYSGCLYLLSHNAQVIIAVTALLTIVGVAIAINYYARNIFLANILYITMYFYFTSMNIGRQFLATSVLLIATIFLRQGRQWWFWGLGICAVLIHITALIGVLFWPMSQLKWTKLKLGLSGLASIVIAGLYSHLTRGFTHVFSAYSMYQDNPAVTGTETLMSQSHGGTVFVMLFYAGFIIIGRMVQEPFAEDNREKQFNFMTLIMVVAIVFGTAFSHNILMTRVLTYFTIYATFYIPEVIDRCCLNYRGTLYEKMVVRMMVIGGTVLVTLIPLGVQLSKNLSMVIPYTSVLFE